MEINHLKVEEIIESRQLQRLKLRYRESENADSVTLIVEVEPHGNGYVARIDPYSINRCGEPLSLQMQPGDTPEASVRAMLNVLDMHLAGYADRERPLLTN